MNDITVFEQRTLTLTAAQVRANVQLIQQVMESVMKEGVHYGIIPGTDKPTLLKPGAEVLMSTFRIAVDPQIEDLSTEEAIRYRIRCNGTHQVSSTFMGAGIGECSSMEEKYKWKKAYKREFEAAPEDRKRIKYGWDKQKRQEYEVTQVRTEPADLANTVLKMAKKRALVDFTLTALAASDCFNQDLEEMDETLRDSLTEDDERRTERTVKPPKSKSDAKREDPPAQQQAKAQQVDPNQKIAAGQVKVVQKAIDRTEGKVKAEAFCKHFEIATLPELPFVKINDALKWISEQQPE